MDGAQLGALLDEGALDESTRHALVFFGAAVSDSRLSHLTCQCLAQRGSEPAPFMELGLQVFLFAGFPRCINVIRYVREHFKVPAPPAENLASEEARSRGEILFRRIYAEQADRVLSSLETLHPELLALILEEAYGRILARPAVTPRTRELCAIVGLMVSNDERQWFSHLQGALRCGATPEDVDEAIRIGGAFTNGARAEEARALVRRITKETESS